ncbi:MAG: hypothetical protein Q4F57_05920 [Weeksellaceae bacterium]|nr:hypothetical protein [Weeksellaceae bacterium]
MFSGLAFAQSNDWCNVYPGIPWVNGTSENFNVTVHHNSNVLLRHWWRNPNNLIDSDLTNFTGETFSLFGSQADRVISVREVNQTYPAGTFAGYHLRITDQVSASSIILRTYHNVGGTRTLKETRTFSQGFTLINFGSDRQTLGFVTSQDFNEIELVYSFQGGISGNLDLFYAVLGRVCPGPSMSCDNNEIAANTPINFTRPTFPVQAGSNVSGFGISAVTNTNNLLTQDTTDYATIFPGSSILGSASVWVEDQLSVYQPGTFAGFDIRSNNLLALGFFNNLQVRTYLNGTLQQTVNSESLFIEAPFLDLNNRRIIGFNATLPFNRVELVVNQPAGVSLSAIDVFNAIIQKPCEGEELECNLPTAINAPEYPVHISLSRTGLSGGACAGCTVTNTDNVINGDPTSFATINMPAGGASVGSIAVKKSLEPWEAGTFAGFEIRNANFINVNLFSAYTITTFLNGVQRESSANFGLLTTNSNLLNGDGRTIMGFETTMTYDEVQISIANGIGLNVGNTQVFNFVVQRFCDMPELECNEYTTLATPQFPVFVNSRNTGVNSAACAACSLTNTQNVLDGNPNTYASLQLSGGLAASGTFAVKLGGDNVIAPGNFVGFDIYNPSLINANFLSGMAFTTYLNGVQQESFLTDGIVVGAGTDLLSASGRSVMGVVPSLPFDELKLDMFNTATLEIGETRIYGAVLSRSCAGVVECDKSYYLTRPEFPVVINAQRTGVRGILCASCAVADPEHVIDANPNNYSEFILDAGVLSTATLSVVDPTVQYPPGTYVGFTLRNPTLLQLDFLETITVRTYLNGVQQEVRTGFNLLDLTLLIPILGNDTRNVGFYASQPFDEVQLEVASLTSSINRIQIFGVLIDTRYSDDGGTGNLNCAEDVQVIANDDFATFIPLLPNVINVLENDEVVNGQINPGSVSLVPPAGATNITTDAQGDVIGVTIPGEGRWTVNPETGVVTFTPQLGFVGTPSPIDYNFADVVGTRSNDATISFDGLVSVNFTPDITVAPSIFMGTDSPFEITVSANNISTALGLSINQVLAEVDANDAVWQIQVAPTTVLNNGWIYLGNVLGKHRFANVNLIAPNTHSEFTFPATFTSPGRGQYTFRAHILLELPVTGIVDLQNEDIEIVETY